jgi:hypothetical protein
MQSSGGLACHVAALVRSRARTNRQSPREREDESMARGDDRTRSCRLDYATAIEKAVFEPSAISNARLHTLLCFHARPINLLV